MSQESSIRKCTIAAASLTGVAAIAAIAVCIMSFIRIRRRADPARFAAPWLKAASVFLLLVMLLTLARHALLLWQIDEWRGAITYETLFAVFAARFHTTVLWMLFDTFAQFCIVVMLASVATGAHSMSRKGVATWVKFSRWGVMAFGAIALALGIVIYGIRVASYVRDYELNMAANDISIASAVIMWLASLGAAGMSILAMGSGTRTVGILLIVANFLNVLGNTWIMVDCIRWPLGALELPDYIAILQDLLGKWTSVGVLLLCYFIMAKRAGGIWTVGAYGSHEARSKDPRVSAEHSSIEQPSH